MYLEVFQLSSIRKIIFPRKKQTKKADRFSRESDFGTLLSIYVADLFSNVHLLSFLVVAVWLFLANLDN